MGHTHLSIQLLDTAFTRLVSHLDPAAPVFRVNQARTWGVSRSEILALERRRHVYKVRHGAYCLAEPWLRSATDDQLRRRIFAAAAIVGMKAPAAACGTFAAELHQLPLPPGEPSGIDLLRHGRTDLRSARDRLKEANRLEGVRTLARDLTHEPIVQVMGVSVVDISTASVTAASHLRRENAIALLDASLNRGVTQKDLERSCDRWAGSRGMADVRELLTLARSGAESPLESVSRIRFLDRGLPEPILQHEFHDYRGFVGRVDMWWPQWRVIGEADGMSKYQDVDRLRQEKKREDRLRAMGHAVVRWTWDEMWNRPSDVVNRILESRRN